MDWRLVAFRFVLPHTGHSTRGSVLLPSIGNSLIGATQESREMRAHA
jgi:hypothetical protein